MYELKLFVKNIKREISIVYNLNIFFLMIICQSWWESFTFSILKTIFVKFLSPTLSNHNKHLLHSLIHPDDYLLGYQTTLLKGAHFLDAQMAVLSSSFSVFTVLGICKFGCELGLFISLYITVRWGFDELYDISTAIVDNCDCFISVSAPLIGNTKSVFKWGEVMILSAVMFGSSMG